MATTQQNRLLAISTPLGEDFLLAQKFRLTEGISQLFTLEIDLLHEETEPGFVPTAIDPSTIVGTGATLRIDQRDGTVREVSGIVARFAHGHRDNRFSYYSATIVPHLWILTQTKQSRIFQNMSVPDIIRAVLNGFDVRWQVQGVTNARNHCVQYRESDFDFISRLMEEEGIYYYFEHLNGKHEMVIANTPQSHAPCPSKSRIPYFLDVTRDQEDFVTAVGGWRPEHRIRTGKVTLWDFNFQLPSRKLDNEQTSVFQLGENRKLEFYDHPGGYARKYDGIDGSGGDRASDLSKVDADKTATAMTFIEMFDSQVKTIAGVGDCASMTAGYRFELFNHPDSSANGNYVITSVTHSAEQNPTYVSDDVVETPYSNEFRCIAHGSGAPPFRPERLTPKPLVNGAQTAFVVGPAGEEIFTDKYGRVKVQFHWDRDGQVNESSSCWVRVAQGWAGNRWGSMFIPRIGMEVIVHFLEGDPDQPIITGCVYNPQTMPPYTLPDEKTKSTVKSNSSKGGAGFNELRFEDKKGSEQIFIHAEKDQDIRVKNDAKEIILHDRHLIVENDQFEKVKKDKHLKVIGDRNEKVDGSISVHAGIDLEEKAGTKFAVDAGSEIHLKSGTTLTIETGTSLTLKVGGNFININTGGIFIKGTMVMLNSGGAAGSGSGSSPTAPTDPLEAATAEPGASVALVRMSPPVRPTFLSPAAQVLVNAAESGAAFCEICSRQ
jgi:type VI secretion system secreted protein VgrG